MTNIPHMIQYANLLYSRYPEIQQSRKIGYIPDTIHQHSDFEIVNFIVSCIREISNQDSAYEVVNISRDVGENFELPWHIDDCALIRHSANNRSDISTYTNVIDIIAGGKYTIYCKSAKRPKYSCIIYWSAQNKDFGGGTFEFADGVCIKPEMRKYVLFDSRDVHRVRQVLWGERKNVLLKFYDT
jgi:hypothetical protein